MKGYKFPDPDNDGYEIVIPNDVIKDVVRDYLQTTYYWSVAVGCFLIGLLTGVLI